MITLTPNSAPTDISHAKDILALVTDPKAAAARLAELHEAIDKANATIADAARRQAEVDANAATHAANSKALDERRAQFEARCKDYEQSAEHQADAVRGRERSVAERETQTTAKEQDLKQREDALAFRERHIADLTRQAEADGKAVADLRSQLERKIAAIRNAIG